MRSLHLPSHFGSPLSLPSFPFLDMVYFEWRAADIHSQPSLFFPSKGLTVTKLSRVWFLQYSTIRSPSLQPPSASPWSRTFKSSFLLFCATRPTLPELPLDNPHPMDSALHLKRSVPYSTRRHTVGSFLFFN